MVYVAARALSLSLDVIELAIASQRYINNQDIYNRHVHDPTRLCNNDPLTPPLAHISSNVITNKTIYKCGLMNCRSLCNKSSLSYAFIHSHQLDFLVITESWLTGDNIIDNQILLSSCPPEFSFISVPRTKRKGGGLVLFYKNFFTVKLLHDFHTTAAYETACFDVRLHDSSMLIVALYRPPSSSISSFEDSFTQLIPSLMVREKFIICGDFNLNVIPQPGGTQSSHDFSFFSSLHLEQHVNESTHIGGRILDLVLSPLSTTITESVRVVDGLSDHRAVLFNLVCLSRSTDVPKQVTEKLFHRINEENLLLNFPSFVAEPVFTTLSSVFTLTEQNHSENSSLIINSVFSSFCDNVKSLLDYCTPLRTIVKKTGGASWWNDKLSRLRRWVRQAERKWQTTKLSVFHDIYRHRKGVYHTAIADTKSTHLRHRLARLHDSPKMLWKELNRSLGRLKSSPLPSSVSDEVLASQFNAFFIQKVSQVRLMLNSSTSKFVVTPCRHSKVLSCFSVVSERQVARLVSKSPTKSDVVDPIPTWLMKKFIHLFLPSITALINAAITFGMPSLYKHGVIRPLLKKPSLDISQLSNYRPVSSLPFLSKIIEKAIAEQLTSHLDAVNGLDPHQSAYRSHHSCETAITYLLNSVFSAADKQRVTVLVLLDLTAAFDCVDHNILCEKLSALGVQGNALNWFVSYLTGRTQSVIIHSTQSTSIPISSGVPQGSVLGPLLFSIYMNGIDEIFKRHSIEYLLYADDIQLWTSCAVSDLASALSKIEECVADVNRWLESCKLCLNASKVEFILLGNPSLIARCGSPSLNIANVSVPAKSAVRDLGVLIDQTLTFKEHVSQVTATSFSHLRLISRVRKSLSIKECLNLVHALVASRVLYCSSIFYKITTVQLNRLQRILNAAIRTAVGRKKCDHLSDIVKKYHWLTIEKLVHLRQALLIFQATRIGIPTYLASLVHVSQSQNLRSHTREDLIVQRSNSAFGSRAFGIYAPTVWNSIPLDVRKSRSKGGFRSKMKHLLFSVS
jgi:hypothetical protein